MPIRDKKAAALLYKKSMNVPKLVAVGSGKAAQRIKAIAKENNIPVIENSALAEELVKLDVNAQIPPDLYQAIARVLVYLYKIDEKIDFSDEYVEK